MKHLILIAALLSLAFGEWQAISYGEKNDRVFIYDTQTGEAFTSYFDGSSYSHNGLYQVMYSYVGANNKPAKAALKPEDLKKDRE